MKTKPKVFYRFIEVNDFTLNPKSHGEYSNKKERILGKAVKAKIILIEKKKK